jgi:hypothetical protein
MRMHTRVLQGTSKMKELQLTKKLGINPFAGIYINSITCHRCGPAEAL